MHIDIHIQMCSCALSYPTLVNLWTVAHQAFLSMDFPGKNTGVGYQFLLRGNLPNPGLKPASHAL